MRVGVVAYGYDYERIEHENDTMSARRTAPAHHFEEYTAITVSLPTSLLIGNALVPQEAGHELLQAYVLSLYRRDRISAGKAAELLDTSRVQFLQMLAAEGLAYLDYSPAELDAEAEVASQWPKQTA